MKKEPLVSIITPNYNCAKYIEETILSVLKQTYQNWELLIIDDCSNDNSYEIINKYLKLDNRIKLFIMNKNRGAAICRNKGIELSKGDYIAFLDSDDLWKKNKIKLQIEFMENKNVDFCYSKYTHMSEDGKKYFNEIRIPSELDYNKMLYHCFTGCLTVIYNQKKIGKIYGPDIAKSNDYGLFLQVLKKTSNAKGIKENLAFYRIRRNSISRNKWKKIYPHFYLLNKIEKINFFKSCFFIFTNILIKKIYK